MTGGTGADQLLGGTGTDTVSYSDHTTPVTADLDGIADDGTTAEADKIATDVENLTGGIGNDTLTGNSSDNSVDGGAGDDTLSGAAGNDTLSGGLGDDALTGGLGDDTLRGGEGRNRCFDSLLDCVDSIAPDLVSFMIDKDSVDTSETAQTITATVHLTDDMSGVDDAVIDMCHGTSARLSFMFNSQYLISGDKFDGTYQFSRELPRYSEQGTWHVCQVYTDDRARNYQWIAPEDLPTTTFTNGPPQP